MKTKINTIKNILFILGLAIFILLSSYFIFRNNKLIGYDSGLYVAEVNRYLKGPIVSLKDHMAVFHEPGGILEAMIFFEMTGLHPAPDFRLLLGIILILKTLLLFKIGIRILKRESLSLIFVVLIIFSNVFINSFYIFIYRQYITEYFFFTLIYLLLRDDIKRQKMVILSLMVASIYIGHRGVSFLMPLLIIIHIVYGRGKKIKKIKMWLFVLIVSLIFSIPYFTISFGYNSKIISDFIKGTKMASQSKYAASNRGISLYDSTQSPYKVEIWKLFIQDSVLIALILSIISSGLRSKNRLIFFIVLLSYILSATNGPNSQRIIYYLFLSLFLLYTETFHKKLPMLFCMVLVIISGASYISGKKPLAPYSTEVEDFFSQFDKEKTIFITAGSYGMLLDELGWKTSESEGFGMFRFNGGWIGKTATISPDFFVNGYKGLQVYDPEINVYAIIPYWLVNHDTPFGFLDLNLWDRSKYFSRIKSPCNSFRSYCYMYKYIGPYQNRSGNMESDFSLSSNL